MRSAVRFVEFVFDWFGPPFPLSDGEGIRAGIRSNVEATRMVPAALWGTASHAGPDLVCTSNSERNHEVWIVPAPGSAAFLGPEPEPARHRQYLARFGRADPERMTGLPAT